MLRFIVHADHRLTMVPYLERWAGDFRSRVELASYGELFHSTRLPACVHVFTDLERLGAEDRERAARVWNALERDVPALPLLNNPLRAMRRYELLRSMHEAGVNDFDVYRLTEARRPKRFPVFIRSENDHAGPESPLLSSQAELDSAVDALCARGKSRDARIAVELCAQRGSDGSYRKYAAFFVGGAVIPRHVFFSKDWLVKSQTKFFDQTNLEEERLYMERNPDADWIASVFRVARIDYGRIDYAQVAGRLQVYEINTNPTIVPVGSTGRDATNAMFTAALTRAYADLDARGARSGGPHAIVMDEPLKSWPGRLAGRVLAKVFKRQLGPLV